MGQYTVPISDIMKKNVDSIINTDYAKGEIYQDTGIKIVDRPETALLVIECVFHGKNAKTGEDFEFEPDQINKLVIEQKFNSKYTDYISIILSLTPIQLMNMQDNYRDLKCTLTMKPIYPKTDYIDHTTIVYSDTYDVLFKDKDIRKRVPKKALIPDSMLDRTIEHSSQMFDNIELQLIKPSIYKLRKTKFNFILRSATVKDVILCLADSCDIKKICLTEPDNKTVYTNMIIPPLKTFSTCMEFLQDYYGIYHKGLAYYYVDDTLYVYPAYDTSPNSEDSAHFYYAGQNSFAGVELYHAYSENKMLHVVVTSTPVIKDLVDTGIENLGNAIMFQHSERIMDVYSSISESANPRIGMGQMNLNAVNTSVVSFGKNDLGISKEAYNVNYVHTGNRFKYESEENAFYRTMVAFQWQNAWPNSFKPGYLVHYHYDGESNTRDEEDELFGVDIDEDEQEYSDNYEYMTKDGICEEVTYTFKPVQGGKQSSIQSFSCVADIILSLGYEPANKEKTPSMNTSMVTKGDSAFSQLSNIKSNNTKNSSSNKKKVTVTQLFSL